MIVVVNHSAKWVYALVFTVLFYDIKIWMAHLSYQKKNVSGGSIHFWVYDQTQ